MAGFVGYAMGQLDFVRPAPRLTYVKRWGFPAKILSTSRWRWRAPFSRNRATSRILPLPLT